MKNSSISCNITPPFLDNKELIKEHYDRETGTPLQDLLIGVQSVGLAAEAVRRCVLFEDGIMPWEAKNKGDCYTFTWLLSDVAEQLSYRSRIVFTNGHAFNIVIDENDSLHMIHGESKDLWLHDIERNKHAQSTFDYQLLIEQGILRQPNDHIIQTTFKTFDLYEYFKSTESGRRIRLPYLEDKTPASTIMTAETGKRALFAYHWFSQSLINGDINLVHTALEGLRTCNPNIETRISINSDLKDFKKLFVRWSRTDSSEISDDQISRVLRAYMDAMPTTKGMLIFGADCMRAMGVARGSENILDAAADMYVECAKHSYIPIARDQTLQGKMKTLANARLKLRLGIDKL